MPVGGAVKSLVGHGKVAALNAKGLAVDQGVRDLSPGQRQHSVEGGPRYTHHPRAFLLLQPFDVPQAHGFYFFDANSHVQEVT